MKKRVTIVLPVLNEKDNLEKMVVSILEKQKKDLSNFFLNIVIADSHSTDGTGEIARRLSKRFKNVHSINTGPGLGVGLYEGHKYAIKRTYPDILVQIDADGQVPENVIGKLIRVIEEGNDLAIGSRFLAGGKNELPMFRKIFSLGASFLCRVIMGPADIGEFTNSARAFTPALFKKINWTRLPWKRRTFIFMPAFINEAVLAGAKYEEVPLVFRNRDQGYSKNKVAKYTWDLVVYCFRARLFKWGFNISWLVGFGRQ